MKLYSIGFLICWTIVLEAFTSTEYEQQFVVSPTDHRALYNAGVRAFQENNVSRAQELFNYIKPICEEQKWDATKGEQLFYNAGNTEMKLKKYDDAIESFEKVLKYNSENEKAREKLELAKKLREQEKKEQQKQEQKEKNKDKDKKEQEEEQEKEEQGQQEEENKNKKSEEDKNQEQDKNDREDQDDQHNEEDNKEQQKQKQDKQGGNKQDNEEQQKSGDRQENADKEDKQEQGKSGTEQEKKSGEKNKDNQNRQENGKPDEKDGPQLTPQEKQLLAQLEQYEQNMQKQVEAQRLQQAKGVINVHNNW